MKKLMNPECDLAAEGAQEKLARVKQLRDQAEDLWWEFGAALHEVHENALYVALGYESWKHYIEQELDISVRAAQHAVATHRWLALFPPDFQEWVHHDLGPSKARLLVGRFAAEEANAWKVRLQGQSYREVEAMLTGQNPNALPEASSALPVAQVEGVTYGSDTALPHRGGDEASMPIDGPSAQDPILYDNVERPEVIHFGLFPDQRRNVDAALALAKQIAETDRDGHALDMICTSYLSADAGYESPQDFLQHVERVLGVRILAVKRDGRILLGEDIREAILSAAQ